MRPALFLWLQIHQQSVYDHVGGPYDAVYFSGSFMLLPDPTACLERLKTQLTPAGARPDPTAAHVQLVGSVAERAGAGARLRTRRGDAHTHTHIHAGRFYFTQTFQLQPAPWLEAFKPWLKWITTIDFGKVTYPSAFLRHLQSAGLSVDMEEVISSHHGRAAKMVVASRDR